MRGKRELWVKATRSTEITERERAHRKLARALAAESIVLLQNDGALPIAPGRVALFGAGAAATVKGGTGSGEVNERHAISIWEGMKSAGFGIATENWLDSYVKLLAAEKTKFYKAFFRKAQKALFRGDDFRINILADSFQYPVDPPVTDGDIAASGTDTCIYVLARQAGECSDRNLDSGEYALAPEEIENIKLCAASYARFILVINAGSSVDIGALDDADGINAILYFCQQGMEGGAAFADILTGAVSPSACLTNTWAKQYDDLPFAREYSYLKGEIGREYYKEGIYVGYRYFDSFAVAPRYAFGYGRTYSDFSMQHLRTNIDNTAVSVAVRVTNTGGIYSGKKIVQLYISCPNGRLKREYQSLAAYAKTRVLAPGEAEDITLSFDMAELAGYDEAASAYILEEGLYRLRLGASSRDTAIIGAISLDQTVITEQCAALCPPLCALPAFAPTDAEEECADADMAVWPIKASDFSTIRHDYRQTEPALGAKAATWLDKLSLAECIQFLFGTENAGRGALNVPGNAASTTPAFLDRGISNLSLCDGPAGVRVGRVSVAAKSGAVKTVEPMVEMLRYAGPLIKAIMFGNPKRGELFYQYATAFPVGTALAQTWNTALLESFGKAIATEMAEFGVTFWLAPGMNIQRNPLCGRNYEYYSEDPILTGKTAAAITRGVQEREGCYVTLKHYAANNQEQLRNHSDSVVSERVLREIYLKAFKIAVRESAAKAVMTSYNLLNGSYTANSYDLCTKLLRNEWGFAGVVMTDWFSTGKGMASNGLAIKSGNDLIMPGGKRYRKALKRDCAKGLLSEADIRRSCARILEAIAGSLTQKELEALRKS
ncbi:MAG: glycoside hydrolase family 3 C-terminal domain-containing protein [Clostridiales bacterium]|nr:glycoside hydrolase family 3 C-terminal domain-containing protein [Clostridiales bacterium]